jgi:histidinol-phosphate phosphatase family protein
MDSAGGKTGWSLFLDRDGVINERLAGDYVKTIDQFRFITGVREALARLKYVFSPIVIVSNQQGIGKGWMTEGNLGIVHRFMLDEITEKDGCIDAIYYCPALESENHPDRKPNTGMALRAKLDFPEIDFTRAYIVGDSVTDMEFGKKLGMKTAYIAGKNEAINIDKEFADLVFPSLIAFSEWVIENVIKFK